MAKPNAPESVPETIRRDRYSSESETVATAPDAIRRDQPEKTDPRNTPRPGTPGPRRSEAPSPTPEP
jgi:hypothetical protein